MIIVIGGGSLREMTDVNDYIASKLEYIRKQFERKPKILFLPQASFESKPYVNSFTREFGTRLKCKTTCALWKNGEMDFEHIKQKFEVVDAIYIGGGRYDVLCEQFNKMGIKQLILDFYKRGGLIVGNSAGGMLMFDCSVSDYKIVAGISDSYEIVNGYGLIEGCFCPHSNEVARIKYISDNNLTCVTLAENEILQFE